MESEKINIFNNETGMPEALELSEKISENFNLEGKNKVYLRLLTEETLSMVRSITGDFKGTFWIEVENEDGKKEITLHLEANTVKNLDPSEKRNLISASSEGKNIFETGIMDKVKNIFEAFLYDVNESFKFQNQYGTGVFDYGILGAEGAEISSAVYSWSMQKYRDSLESQKNLNEINEQAWDELEKSIIANIADDVKIGVKNNIIDLAVIKKF